jgi:hypothetical protein
MIRYVPSFILHQFDQDTSPARCRAMCCCTTWPTSHHLPGHASAGQARREELTRFLGEALGQPSARWRRTAAL